MKIEADVKTIKELNKYHFLVLDYQRESKLLPQGNV